MMPWVRAECYLVYVCEAHSAIDNAAYFSAYAPRMTLPLNQRERAMDALRGFALLGVLIVNIQSYTSGAESNPSGVHDALAGFGAGQWLAGTLLFVINGFFEMKSYSLLTFLFGYGLAMQHHQLRLRGADIESSLRRRMKWLAIFGALHGVLLYYGDVLLRYAIVGTICIAMMGYPWRSQRALRIAIASAVVSVVLFTALSLATSDKEWFDAAQTANRDGRAAQAALLSGDLLYFIRRNALDFSYVLLSLIISLPLFFVPFAIGVAFARWRLLNPRKTNAHAATCKRIAKRLLVVGLFIGLPCSLLHAWQLIHMANSKADSFARWSNAISLPGMLLSLIYVAAAMYLAATHVTQPKRSTMMSAHANRSANRSANALVSGLVNALANALANIGKRSLSNYLLQSVVMFALLSPFVVGRVFPATVTWGIVPLTLFAISFYAVMLVVNAIAEQRGWPGPAELLMRRLTK
jgi:uncharacterized protein